MLLDKAILLTLAVLAAAARPKNAILLSDVQTLTLRGGDAKTTHRRVSAIPQLKCVSSKAICALYDIDRMRCTNQGSSYGSEDIEWSCTASLPEELKLGSTDVICEGYSSPDDPYVLKGSCGVEYRMALTEKGEQKYPDVANGRLWYGGGGGTGGTDWSAWIFSVIFIAVLLWILYSAFQGYNNQGRQAGPGRNYGGGGGGGGGGGPGGWGPGWGPDNGNDPPPPYPGTKPSGSQQGWRPGFWSGLAGGAAAAYAAGNRNNRNDRYDRYPRGYGTSGSGYGDRTYSGGSSSSTGSTSARHESTGFGSTNRR
ncbi:hypothetical protein S40288_07311 [Stachybotrys chartarum IBT 40288]|nr:hypothetical protein S40288_07311 [Stachybotrys chartarum IBT 40288]